MTPSGSIYTYTPEQLFDCGELGDQEITFTALVVSDWLSGSGRKIYKATIQKAVVNFDFGNGHKAEVDVTHWLRQLRATWRSYEEEIEEKYRAECERERGA